MDVRDGRTWIILSKWSRRELLINKKKGLIMLDDSVMLCHIDGLVQDFALAPEMMSMA